MSRLVRSFVTTVASGLTGAPLAEHFHRDAFRAQALLTRGNPPRTIFDVGANKGQTATKYRSLFPKAKIHCFEPFEETLRVLRRNLKSDSQVEIVTRAVAETSGTRRLHVLEHGTMNSLHSIHESAHHYIKAEKTRVAGETAVDCVTLDEYCRERGIDRIDILKLDIQGGERNALAGAESLLRGQRVGLIFTEVLFADLYRDQGHFEDLTGVLRHHHYTLFGLYDLRLGPNHVLGWGNAIFISPAVEGRLRERKAA